MLGDCSTEVLNEHQVEVASEISQPRVVDHNKVVLIEPKGPGAAEEVSGCFLSAFPDLKVDVHQVIADDDTAVVRFALDGTDRGRARARSSPRRHSCSNTPTNARKC